MKVRSKINVNDYFKLEKNKEYVVRAIVYYVTPFIYQPGADYVPNNFVNPLYSHGFLPNETVYLIETKTATGRKTLVRFLTTNFNVIDTGVDDN